MQISSEDLKTIQKVINKVAPKFAFNIFSIEDLKQESFIICCEILKKYNGVSPLENFLSRSLNNRLKNFVRNNKKRNNFLSLLDNDGLVEDDYINDTENLELLTKIDTHLEPKYRGDYLRLKDGVSLPKKRREEIYERIREILSS